ncbi:unnamed protein product [Rotaria sordida]|uniref:Hemerythrin-like domain-containing protein n=1 Tax=Rotaria sordida TaxID=392033 RepID=A0A814SU44_9BILA|nr:unnamed protein product [Rotaria sordida]CAF1149608.1 unnamed protein product [Rotaria sordida]CAF1152883.1 unnamed protein product [Rotaria sordida]
MFLFRRLILTSILTIHRPIMTSSSSQSVGIIDLILSEHKYMRDEYEYFKSVKDLTKLDTRIRQWIAYIALHGHKEEIAFYPKIESYLDDGKKDGHHIIKHGIKEHRELETELKKLVEQSPMEWKQICKAVDRLVHHLNEEESDILNPLRSKLNDKFQLELAQQFIAAGQLASDKPHPELSKKPEETPQENINVGLAEKHQDF